MIVLYPLLVCFKMQRNQSRLAFSEETQFSGRHQNHVRRTSASVGNGYSYWLRSSTNLSLPLTNWIIVATNPFDAQGNFSNRIPLTPGSPQLFYRIQMPWRRFIEGFFLVERVWTCWNTRTDNAKQVFAPCARFWAGFSASLVQAMFIWTVWLTVVGALALIGAARVVWVWRKRPPRWVSVIGETEAGLRVGFLLGIADIAFDTLQDVWCLWNVSGNRN
jgi:hypothetical protein